MPIHFDLKRMSEVMEAHKRWWNGESNLIYIDISDAYEPDRTASVPTINQSNCADFRYSPEEIIDAYDIALSQHEYLGAAYPHIGFESYGPGVLSAFCGGTLDNSSGAVWFFPPKWFTGDTPLSELHVKYDPENKWAKRIKDIYRAGIKKWNGIVIMGMPDLGGVMDVLAALVTSERLLYSLVDEPDEVLRLVSETENAWYDAYSDMASVLSPQNGYTDWSCLLSDKPSYISQCDFCYMLGSDMFRKFVLPSIRRDTETLTNVIYHLDGIGELTHLDDILKLEKLKAIQWVYGTGKPKAGHWIDVYKKIADAGKGIFVIDGVREFFDVADRIDAPLYTRQGITTAYLDDPLYKRLIGMI